MTDRRAAEHRALVILVVENHQDTRLAVVELLSQLGHAVTGVSTLNEALVRAPAIGPDVVISDIGLPDGSGWELPQRLTLPYRPFAIAMSGFGMREDRERSRAAGYRHHLVKPMDLEALEALLIEAERERVEHGTAR